MVGQERMKRNRIRDVLFPPRCPVCDEILEPELVGETYIHKKCEQKLLPVRGAVCMHCGRPVELQQEYCYDCKRKEPDRSFVQGKALFVYRGSIRKTMYRFKYANKREYGDFFAEQAVAMYGEWLKKKQIDAIIPVPMYEPKKRKRGYNQAECFAKALSKETGIPLDAKLVTRCRDTAPQKELNDMQRRKNLKGAFLCKGNEKHYERVLLVDDIYTTGSTADAVTECLQNAGIEQVYYLSICIGAGMCDIIQNNA